MALLRIPEEPSRREATAWRLLHVMAGHWRLRVVSESEAGGGSGSSGVTTERCKTDAESELLSWARARGCTLATPATLARLRAGKLQDTGEWPGVHTVHYGGLTNTALWGLSREYLKCCVC